MLQPAPDKRRLRIAQPMICSPWRAGQCNGPSCSASAGVRGQESQAGEGVPVAVPFAGILRIQAWCVGLMAGTSMERLKRPLSGSPFPWESTMALPIAMADDTRLADRTGGPCGLHAPPAIWSCAEGASINDGVCAPPPFRLSNPAAEFAVAGGWCDPLSRDANRTFPH